MANLKGFRALNNLRQKDVADYLGVTTSFITYVERGRNMMPEGRLYDLIHNDRGWDPSPLLEEAPVPAEQTAPALDTHDEAADDLESMYRDVCHENADLKIRLARALKRLADLGVPKC